MKVPSSSFINININIYICRFKYLLLMDAIINCTKIEKKQPNNQEIPEGRVLTILFFINKSRPIKTGHGL